MKLRCTFIWQKVNYETKLLVTFTEKEIKNFIPEVKKIKNI